MNEFLAILKHDLHKLQIKGAIRHSKALLDNNMKRADSITSWFSRNGDK